MQAHLQEWTAVCRDRLCQAARATASPSSPLLLFLPRGRPWGALESASAPQPCHHNLSPLGVVFCIWESLFPAELVSSSLNIYLSYPIYLLFHHPFPPFQIIEYHRKKFIFLLFHFIVKDRPKSEVSITIMLVFYIY